MKKETLEELVNTNLSRHKIAKKLKCSYTNVQYWLKKYNIIYPKSVLKVGEKICPKCNESKPYNEFYKRSENTYYSYCKPCASNQTTDRQKALKAKCVEYKGGKCESCNYSKSQAALQFHHLNPSEKDFTISAKTLATFDSLKPELDKCILLCANCHAEEHEK